MQHAHFWLDFLWNNHDWYKIDDYADFARAILWCTVNLVTAYSYFAIPYEIWHWRKYLGSLTASFVGVLFILFIVLCGAHHIVDVIIMPTAPWWAIWSINVPMAVVSFVTAEYLRRNRSTIIDVLKSIEDLLRNISIR